MIVAQRDACSRHDRRTRESGSPACGRCRCGPGNRRHARRHASPRRSAAMSASSLTAVVRKSDHARPASTSPTRITVLSSAARFRFRNAGFARDVAHARRIKLAIQQQGLDALPPDALVASELGAVRWQREERPTPYQPLFGEQFVDSTPANASRVDARSNHACKSIAARPPAFPVHSGGRVPIAASADSPNALPLISREYRAGGHTAFRRPRTVSATRLRADSRLHARRASASGCNASQDARASLRGRSRTVARNASRGGALRPRRVGEPRGRYRARHRRRGCAARHRRESRSDRPGRSSAADQGPARPALPLQARCECDRARQAVPSHRPYRDESAHGLRTSARGFACGKSKRGIEPVNDIGERFCLDRHAALDLLLLESRRGSARNADQRGRTADGRSWAWIDRTRACQRAVRRRATTTLSPTRTVPWLHGAGHDGADTGQCETAVDRQSKMTIGMRAVGGRAPRRAGARRARQYLRQ